MVTIYHEERRSEDYGLYGGVLYKAEADNGFRVYVLVLYADVWGESDVQIVMANMDYQAIREAIAEIDSHFGAFRAITKGR